MALGTKNACCVVTRVVIAVSLSASSYTARRKFARIGHLAVAPWNFTARPVDNRLSQHYSEKFLCCALWLHDCIWPLVWLLCLQKRRVAHLRRLDGGEIRLLVGRTDILAADIAEIRVRLKNDLAVAAHAKVKTGV